MAGDDLPQPPVISSVQLASVRRRPATRATTVPGRDDSSTTRWPSRTASRTSWVTNRIAVPVACPDPQQLALQHVAGDRVQRRERLVHQQHPGRPSPRRRPSWRPARGPARRAGACRRTARAAACRPARRAGPAPAARRRARRRSRRPWPGELQRQLDVAPRGQPRQQRGLLEHERRPRRAELDRRPCVGSSSPATRLSSVDLPQPDAPSRQTNSPGCDAQVDAAQRGHRVRAVAEHLADRRAASARAPASAGVRALDGRGHRSVTPGALSSPAASTAGLPAAVQHVVQRRRRRRTRRGRSPSRRRPAVTLSLASCGNVAASGSAVERRCSVKARSITAGQRLAGELLDRVVHDGLGLRLVRVREVDRLLRGRAAAPRRSPGAPAGTAVRTISTVVGNLPSGHRVFSSTQHLRAGVETSRELHGSGSQPPSTSP